MVNHYIKAGMLNNKGEEMKISTEIYLLAQEDQHIDKITGHEVKPLKYYVDKLILTQMINKES